MSMLEHCIRNRSLPWSSSRLPRKPTVSRSPWREPLSVLSLQSMCHHLPSRFPPRLLWTTPGKLQEEAETVQDVVEATQWSTHVGVWSDEEYLATKEARIMAHKKCEMIPRCVITVSLDTMRYTLYTNCMTMSCMSRNPWCACTCTTTKCTCIYTLHDYHIPSKLIYTMAQK